MKYLSILLVLLGTSLAPTLAQKVALKTNLLYAGVAQTPNLGVEVGLGKRTTLELSGGYNPWHRDANSKKLVHWMGQLEMRYWFCERFNGAFIGVHALGSQFNIAGHKLPWLFGNDSENYNYQGSAFGAGISVGYQFILARRWNLELNAGFGYARIYYDKYECVNCNRFIESSFKNYYGPTRAGISIIFLIGKGK